MILTGKRHPKIKLQRLRKIGIGTFGSLIPQIETNCFKIKVLKMFDTFTNCHIETCRSLKRRATLKISSTVFRRTYVISVGFKMKTLRKCIFEF